VPAAPEPDHVRFDDDAKAAVCARCGALVEFRWPIPLDEFGRTLTEFDKAHRRCVKPGPLAEVLATALRRLVHYSSRDIHTGCDENRCPVCEAEKALARARRAGLEGRPDGE
jgi:hypothetical protein